LGPYLSTPSSLLPDSRMLPWPPNTPTITREPKLWVHSGLISHLDYLPSCHGRRPATFSESKWRTRRLEIGTPMGKVSPRLLRFVSLLLHLHSHIRVVVRLPTFSEKASSDGKSQNSEDPEARMLLGVPHHNKEPGQWLRNFVIRNSKTCRQRAIRTLSSGVK
jgi:hypothetical protein